MVATPPLIALQLAVATVELCRWKLEGPLGWLWPTAWEPRSYGCAALVSLVISALIARWAQYHALAVLGFLNLGGAFIAVLLLAFHLQVGPGGEVLLSSGVTSATTTSGPPAWLLRAVAVALLMPLLIKLLQLHRLAGRWRARVPQADTPLLPSQEEVATRLTAAVTSQDVGSAGQVVQLRGRWGDGKTFVLRQVANRLSNQSITLAAGSPSASARCAPVWIDVWEHEAVSDLHAETVEALLSHPVHCRNLRWLGYPVTFGRRMLNGMRVSAKFTAAEVEVPVTLARLPYQRGLERSLKRSGAVAMLVLDEIDRASPLAAQTALTLLRRSLDLPRVTVIVPYVESVLLFKAFSPYFQQLPDLEAMLRSSMVLVGLWPPTTHDASALVQQAGTGENDGKSASAELQTAWSALFALSFGEAAEERRSQAQRYAASKMLDSRPIEMAEVSLKEIGDFVVMSVPIRAVLERLLASVPPAPAGSATASIAGLDVVRDRVSTHLPQLVREARIPPLRPLQAWLLALLDVYVPPPPTFEAVAEFVTVAAAAAVTYCPDK